MKWTLLDDFMNDANGVYCPTSSTPYITNIAYANPSNILPVGQIYTQLGTNWLPLEHIIRIPQGKKYKKLWCR